MIHANVAKSKTSNMALTRPERRRNWMSSRPSTSHLTIRISRSSMSIRALTPRSRRTGCLMSSSASIKMRRYCRRRSELASRSRARSSACSAGHPRCTIRRLRWSKRLLTASNTKMTSKSTTKMISTNSICKHR